MHHIQKFPNREKHKRRWLIYSAYFDRVFCFCCELINVVCCTSKLANKGSRDWINLNTKLNSHEITNEQITNMNAWIDLEKRLSKSKTIDKYAQEEINRDVEHQRKLLLRIVVVVKTLGKSNLALCGKKWEDLSRK